MSLEDTSNKQFPYSVVRKPIFFEKSVGGSSESWLSDTSLLKSMEELDAQISVM